jgi:hypothetical protein
VLQTSNQIGDVGARGLGGVLKVNRSLQNLHLVRRFFILICLLRGRLRKREGRGWAALTRVLQSYNQIGDVGARWLGEGLKVNSSLQALSLVRHFSFCP